MMKFCSGTNILVCLLSMSLQISDVDNPLLSMLTPQSIGKLHLRFSTYGSIGQNLLWMKKITFNIEYIFNLVMPLFTKRGTAFPLKDITMKRMCYLFSPPESAILSTIMNDEKKIKFSWNSEIKVSLYKESLARFSTWS
jgi:hypothetical protein